MHLKDRPGASILFNAKITLTADEEKAAMEEFDELLKEIYPRFRESIKAWRGEIKRRKQMFMPEFVAQRIEQGFCNLYWEDSSFGGNPAYFFMSLFCDAYKRGDEQCKKELAERLRSFGTKGLSPLFLELLIGSSYSARGFAVERTPPGSGPDLKVLGGKRPLFIECKCISSAAGIPINRNILSLAIQLLDPVVDAISSEISGFPVLSVRYLGTRQVAADQTEHVLAKLAEAASQAQALGFPFENDLWRLSYRKSEVVVETETLSTLERVTELFPEEMKLKPVLTTQPSKGVVHFYADIEHDLPNRIGRELRDALNKQMSNEGLNLIVVQVSGVGMQYPPGSDQYCDFLVDRVLQPDSTRDAILSAGVDLAGVFVIGDYFPSQQNGLSILNYYGAFVESLQDANVAEFCWGYWGGDLSRLTIVTPRRSQAEIIAGDVAS